MSQVAEIVELRRIRPVKWSQIDKKADDFKHRLVQLFLKYEGCPLLNEDGSPLVDAAGRRQDVKAANFGRRFGVAPRTFQDWIVEVRGITVPGNQRFSSRADVARLVEEQHGMCACCPEWKEE